MSSFLSEVKSLVNAKSCPKLAISDFSVFDISEPCFQTVKGFDWINKIHENEKFDLILGDLPLGMNRKEYEFRGHKLKIRQNWAELLKSLGCLEKNGVGIFLVEPMAFSSAEGAIVESTLNSAGYYVNIQRDAHVFMRFSFYKNHNLSIPAHMAGMLRFRANRDILNYQLIFSRRERLMV